MRALIVLPLALAALAGCIDAGSPTDPDGVQDLQNGMLDQVVSLIENYNGTVLSAHAEAGDQHILSISPDQLGDVERWFWVHENTTALTLELESSDELDMYVLEPECHDFDCAIEVSTSAGVANHTVDSPLTGGWEVVFFKQELGVAEIDYSLKLTKNQTHIHEVEHEVYPGEVVAVDAAVFWISPDQLGDVFREFWVPEGTTEMTINVTSDPDMRFVLGQSNPSRDGSSEEYYPTANGRVDIHIEDPHIGGWYFIAFAPEQPGVHQIQYTADITKQSG